MLARDGEGEQLKCRTDHIFISEFCMQRGLLMYVLLLVYLRSLLQAGNHHCQAMVGKLFFWDCGKITIRYTKQIHGLLGRLLEESER